MVVKQLRNFIAYTGKISLVCSVHINRRSLIESLQEPQDAQDTQDIIRHKSSSPKLIHNNVQYAII